jgi:hypothetical protein
MSRYDSPMVGNTFAAPVLFQESRFDKLSRSGSRIRIHGLYVVLVDNDRSFLTLDRSVSSLKC